MEEWISLHDEPWWPDFDPAGKVWVAKADQGVHTGLLSMGKDRCLIGKHLQTHFDWLHPIGMYYAFIKKHYRISFRRQLRYRNIYAESKASVPEKILEVAMAHGIDVVTAEMAAGIPEDATTEEVMQGIAANVVEMPKAAPVHVVAPDRRVMVREAFQEADARLQKLPGDQLIDSTHAVCKMLLWRAGCRTPQKIRPEEIPQGYRNKRKLKLTA